MNLDSNMPLSIIVDFLMHHDASHQAIQCGGIQFLNVSVLRDAAR